MNRKNQFEVYRSNTANMFLNGLSEVRKEALNAITEHSFDNKVKQNSLNSQESDVANAEKKAEQLRLMMLKMKTVFDVKEKKWKEEYENSVIDYKLKMNDNDKLRIFLNESEIKNLKLVDEAKNLKIDLEDAQVKILSLEKQVEFYKKEVSSFLSAQKDSGKPMSVLDARLSSYTSINLLKIIIIIF